ncbi:hypothetical protein [Nocardioides cynanchi]|uniref:hypothetical protein n=1 Tax=Nocardioides cynanchi TaxID=2558918 RepID=UPI0012441B1C|nr:hypothetical protein [Nocardioides cynanchi]
MPTALSSTDAAVTPYLTPGRVAAARRAFQDVAILFRFRAQAVRRRHLTRTLSISFTVITLAIAIVPAYLPGAAGAGKAFDIFLLIPSAMAGVLVLNMSSAIASGGGRELISRDQASPYPISPTTDHLGALVLAPLNIAWMIQAWVLLGSMSYSLGSGKLFQAQVVMVLWLVFSTAIGQVIAWSMEAVRRSRFGIAITRGLLVLIGLAAGVVQLTHNSLHLLDRIPTIGVFHGAVDGWSVRWLLTVLGLVAAGLVCVVLGAIPAHVAARRMPRDEARMETDQHEPRPPARTVLGTLVRGDRASVWRSVPMRRGMMVLAIGPGLVAIFGNLPWPSMTILPGLVASGGALLFGVNAWCLDGRGALWRENLPVAPTVIFDARTYVLAEFLASASLLTIAIGALRAGVPNAQEFSALVCTLLVVLLQVVGASMRWSLAHPYPVDLRSARATPAPPAAMVGYSARLALCTTVTSLFFSGLAHVPDWRASVMLAVPCLIWSGVRLVRTRRRWEDPLPRALVVTTTAA